MRNIGNYFLDSAYSLSVNCNTESFYNFVAMKPPQGAHLQLFFEIKGREIPFSYCKYATGGVYLFVV